MTNWFERISTGITTPSAWFTGVTTPLALYASKTAGGPGSSAALLLTAVAGAIAGAIGAVVTLRKANGDLASQLHADAGKFMDRQRATIAEQDRKISDLQGHFAEMQAYILEDAAWHMAVLGLMNEHSLDAPQPPVPPYHRAPPGGST